MKKLLAVLCTILIGTLFVMPVSAFDESTVADEMNVNIVVNEDGTIDVKTILDVTFSDYRRGIYVTLPQRYDVTMNGKDKTYYFPVTDIIVRDNHDLKKTENRDGVTLRFGNEYEELIGPVQYEYAYTLNTRDLDLDGLQMVYYNIVGKEWEFPIKKTTFSIEMPKAFGDEIYLYSPSGSEVPFQRSGNTIKGVFNEEIRNGGLTVEIPLPNDYFTFPNIDYRVQALGFGALVAAIVAFVFMKFGRDPLITESVEFTAPEGLSSAEIGYVYRGMVLQKDITSLIIYWASQGFLTIEELDKDVIKLAKLKDLPESRPTEERRVFLALFKGRDEVTTKELEQKFAATVSHAINGIPKRFTSDPELRVFNRTASFMKVLMSIIAPLVPAFYFAASAYAVSGNPTDKGLFFFIAFGVFIVITIGGSFLVAYDRVHKTSQRVGNSLLLVLIVVAASMILTAFMPSGVITASLFVMIALYLVAVFSAANTGKRTEQGTIWIGQILGLRNFIEVAEHDRLVALAEETPEIFYDILPYAYVLGVTDVWSKKFESIAISQPEWYVGTNPNFSSYLLWSSLNRSMSTLSSSMVSVPAPKGSTGGGGTFGGGGGGGGFSGGGFGGGGGGSW